MTTQSSGVMHLFSYGSNQGVLVDSMVVRSFEGVIKYVKIQKEEIEQTCTLQAQINLEPIDCTTFGISTSIQNNQKSYIEEWFLNNRTAEFLILDDDKILNELTDNLKNRWIQIDPMLGITESIRDQILERINN